MLKLRFSRGAQMIMRQMFVLLLLVFFAASLSAASTVSVRSYNVENLFDTEHDEGKTDWTYLPLSVKKNNPQVWAYCRTLPVESWRNECFNLDWNDKVLNVKIQNIAKVLRAVNQGKGADVIVVEEVENKKVLKMLVDLGLAGMGYKYISLIEGPDERGIDVGVISRYPIIKEKLHLINLRGTSGKSATRGILEVDIKINNKIMTVFGNHWPSQGSKTDTRLRASEVLLDKASKAIGDMVVAVGDFNTVDEDMPHPFDMNILPVFDCAETKAREFRTHLHPGTNWHRGEWSSLDRIFVLKESQIKAKSFKPLWNKFEIINDVFVLKEINWRDYSTGRTEVHVVPNRFDPVKKTGFSDHLGIYMEFAL